MYVYVYIYVYVGPAGMLSSATAAAYMFFRYICVYRIYVYMCIRIYFMDIMYLCVYMGPCGMLSSATAAGYLCVCV